MSLLMDALKRAEETKQDAARQMTSVSRPPPGSLSLEPKGGPAPTPLPELAQHIDALDADLAAPAPASPRFQVKTPPPTTPTLSDANRDAVRNAFAAKLAAAEPQRNPLWLVLGGLGLAAAAIGVYVWYQLTQMGNHNLAHPTAGTSSPAPVSRPAAAPVTAPTVVGTATTLTGNHLPVTEPPPPRLPPEAPAASADSVASTPVRLVKTRPQPDPSVGRAYQNLQVNSLEAARRDYEQALKYDAKNVDALLGLAAIAQRQGRPADAERFNQLALEADPKDAAAQAAVLGGATSADPSLLESRLKTLLAAQPESAPLNFALGNLYARQSRWADAQQAYFNAVAAEGDNPDYLMNLAVSLDHLHQPRLAAQHYRLALEAADKRPAAFDRERVRKRQQELQP